MPAGLGGGADFAMGRANVKKGSLVSTARELPASRKAESGGATGPLPAQASTPHAVALPAGSKSGPTWTPKPFSQ